VLTHSHVDPEVAELLSAWEQFDLGLRLREGLSEGAYDRLRIALQACADAWRDLPAIPRLGANVLVDMFPSTEANTDLYEGDIRDRILEIAFEIQDLVRECVAVSEE
jgi:hypothetical protein